MSPRVTYDQDGHPHLSPREAETARLIAAGHTYAQIAKRLDLSPHTIRNRARMVRRKWQCADRADITATARRKGIAP